MRRRTGGGASWQYTSPWRYCKIEEDGERGAARYADTLQEIREDFVNDEDAFEYEIQKRSREDWLRYGTLYFGPSGPVLKRG